MEEKKIFEGLIEEARRVKQEHSEAHLMMLMVEEGGVENLTGCMLKGNKQSLIIALAKCMKEDRDLADIIMHAIIMWNYIK